MNMSSGCTAQSAGYEAATAVDVDLSEIRRDAEKWFGKQVAKRDALAEEARVEAGDSGFISW